MQMTIHVRCSKADQNYNHSNPQINYQQHCSSLYHVRRGKRYSESRRHRLPIRIHLRLSLRCGLRQTVGAPRAERQVPILIQVHAQNVLPRHVVRTVCHPNGRMRLGAVRPVEAAERHLRLLARLTQRLRRVDLRGHRVAGRDDARPGCGGVDVDAEIGGGIWGEVRSIGTCRPPAGDRHSVREKSGARTDGDGAEKGDDERFECARCAVARLLPCGLEVLEHLERLGGNEAVLHI